jgi:NAD(P)H-dependent flavin oxidoreductase YrpB (nitropropane dioxygenase family)
MKTILCDRLRIDVPIIQAAMGGADGPALAAAVSEAGGLGMLALWHVELEVLRETVRRTRTLTDRPFGVNLNLRWPQEERLNVCLEEGVPVISFFWGEPGKLIDRAHDGNAVVLHSSASAAEARRVVDQGVDVVVAQGWEAGGHVRGTVSTMSLVPAVVNAVALTPVVAAGGIADGRGLAAALALGASGVWIGTRFLASVEANIHPRYRQLLLEATENDTYYSELFDVGWSNAPHRVLRNRTVAEWEAAGRPSPGSRPGEGEVIATSPSRGEVVRYQSFTPSPDTEGDIDALALWAGQSVGLLSEVKPARAIVREIVDDAQALLSSLSDMGDVVDYRDKLF